MYEFGYLFLLQGFMSNVFCYYNLSLTQLHPNGWTTLSFFDKLFRIHKVEPMINIFIHYYTLINNVEWEAFHTLILYIFY
jgi:hypothetical protein